MHVLARASLATLGALCLCGAVDAATFTRILDPMNPIVNDALESGGGAWADLDGDGLPELFVAHGNLTSQNDALHWNLGAGAFARVVTAPMASDGGSSIGACFGDWNNDGRLDLFVVNRAGFGNFLYRALGDSTFERVTTGAVAADRHDANSASWVDLDRDGALDLYVVNFREPDDLYRNTGPPDFDLVPVDTGAVLGGAEFSIPGAWCDVDDDGDLDLFVGNAGNQNDVLYRQVAPFAFVPTVLPDGRSTLGASWGDFDNDGDLDLFAASFLGQASVLWVNAGAPTWALAALPGAFDANPGNAVGSAWGDFDNDADLDLFVARDGQDNLLFVNGGPPSYPLVRVDTLGVSTDGGASFGCGWSDIDGDGDLDLFVANRTNQSDFLYRNDGIHGAWLALTLRGTASNRAALGARVRVKATVGGVPRWQVRDVEAQSGYNSQTLALHFGLGDAASADSVVVRWPSGHVDVFTNVPASRAWRLVEGATLAADGPTRPRAPGLRVVPHPVRGPLAVELDVHAPGPVTLQIFDLAGRRVAAPVTALLSRGRQRLEAPALHAPPGVYVARIVGGGVAAGTRFVLLP